MAFFLVAAGLAAGLQSNLPKGYICLRADTPIAIDGRLSESAWSKAPWTDDFVDIEGAAKPIPRFRTRAKMLWDSRYLYIGAEIQEPDVQASLTKHDSVIFHDNDFEVFLDPDGDGQLYSELELNARNTTWDLLLVHSYRGGGPPVDGWEIKGLKTAVHVDGKLNSMHYTDKGWTVEIAIPWTALTQIAGCPCPPRNGDQWRINFSRVEWPGSLGQRPGVHEDNWVWSPQGVIDMHRPEMWGYLQFSSSPKTTVLKQLEGFREEQVLAKVWQAERDFRDKTGRWSDSVAELRLDEPGLRIWATPDLFEADFGGYRVDQNLRFWKAIQPE